MRVCIIMSIAVSFHWFSEYVCVSERQRERWRRYTIQIQNSLRTQITFSVCWASEVGTFWKHAASAEYAYTPCFPARESTLAYWLLSASSARSRFTRVQLSVYGVQKIVCHDDIQNNIFVHQNQILCVIYTQMCVIGNTATFSCILWGGLVQFSSRHTQGRPFALYLLPQKFPKSAVLYMNVEV